MNRVLSLIIALTVIGSSASGADAHVFGRFFHALFHPRSSFTHHRYSHEPVVSTTGRKDETAASAPVSSEPQAGAAQIAAVTKAAVEKASSVAIAPAPVVVQPRVCHSYSPEADSLIVVPCE